MKEKRCSACNQNKPTTEFDVRRLKTKVVFQARCRDCLRVYHRNWYKKHKKVVRARNLAYNRKRTIEFADRLAALKSEPCADCGLKFPRECMDFDHVRGTKSFNIGWAKWVSPELLEDELQKCELVCSNCHRIRTFARMRQRIDNEPVR